MCSPRNGEASVQQGPPLDTIPETSERPSESSSLVKTVVSDDQMSLCLHDQHASGHQVRRQNHNAA